MARLQKGLVDLRRESIDFQEQDFKDVKFEESWLAAMVSGYSHKVDLAYLRCEEEDSFLTHVTSVKVDADSKKYRHQGKLLFREGKYLEAVKAFTEAVKTAGSALTASKAVIKRSALLYRLGLYRECLSDITIAYSSKIPATKQDDVFLRQEDAEIKQNDQPLYNEGFPWLTEKSENIDCAADNIRMETVNEQAKIIASRNIRAGEIIAVEDPFVGICIENRHFHCDHCLKIIVSGIPCYSCSKVHYCSMDCMNYAYITYHNEECKIIAMLQPYELYGMIVKMALSIRYHVDKLTTDDPNRYMSNRYMEIMNLSTDRVELDRSEMENLENAAARLFQAIEKHTTFIIKDGSEDKQANVLKGLIMKLMLIKRNHFKDEVISKELANGRIVFQSRLQLCHAFHDFLNHSCTPNVMVIQCGVTKVSRALDHIKKDAELFVSHGCYYWELTRAERHRKLEFTCNCLACQEKWLLFEVLPSCGLTPKIDIVENVVNKLREDRSGQRAVLNKVVEVLNMGIEQNTIDHARYVSCFKKCFSWLNHKDDPVDVIVKFATEEDAYVPKEEQFKVGTML